MQSTDLTYSKQMSLSQRLVRYKAWANARSFGFMLTLPDAEIAQPRETFFGSILSTLQHNYVVDDIFKTHLEGRSHGYTDRLGDTPPALALLWENVRVMDDWWISHVDGLTGAALQEEITFDFIGGGAGRMTRAEIVMHVVNHTSYHRGFVDELLGQIAASSPACDFPVYLQEMARQPVQA
ncbi:MAG: DinB family protein [Albidovulum sp.]